MDSLIILIPCSGKLEKAKQNDAARKWADVQNSSQPEDFRGEEKKKTTTK